MRCFAVAVGVVLAGLGCKSDEGGGSAGTAAGATAAVGGTFVAGTGGTTAAGTGGTTTTAGAGGFPAGTGGTTAAGTGGTTAAGTGGTTAAGTGGTTAAGTGGTTAAGTGGTGAGDLTMCISNVMANGRDMTCASCLCGMCNPELMAVDGDVNAQAMLDCITTNNCAGSCCLCNSADCTAGAAEFGNGPCGNEIQVAAGVTPMTGLLGAIANGSMVSTNCAPTGPTDNSCADAARLGDCLTMKCMAECPSTAICM